MTIQNYCDNLPKMKMSDLILRIEKDKLQKYENIIVRCMDKDDKILIDHNVNFNNSILNI